MTCVYLLPLTFFRIKSGGNASEEKSPIHIKISTKGRGDFSVHGKYVFIRILIEGVKRYRVVPTLFIPGQKKAEK
jgi:hypothetical protein